MKQRYSIFLVLLFLISGAYAQDLPYIEVHPEEAELTVGDTIAFTAVYVDTAEQETDTTVVWSVVPEGLGRFVNSNVFVADSAGEGFVIAQFGDLSDTAGVGIEAPDDDEDPEYEEPSIEIVGENDNLAPGDTAFFKVVYKDSMENKIDTLVAMSVFPDSLGSFLDDTTFVANMAGEGYLAAQLGGLADTLEIEVEAEEDDDEDPEYEEPSIEIVGENDDLAPGDTAFFKVVYKDSMENEIDTLVAMSVFPDSLGSFLDDTTFVANMAGEGYLAAQLGGLADTLEIEVEAEEDDDEDPEYEEPSIEIVGENDDLAPGDTAFFKVVYKDSMENEIDTLVAMSVFPDSLGSFLDDTTFVANMAGEGYLAAQLGELADTLEIEVEVEDDDEDDTEQPKIKIWAENRVFFTGDTTRFKVIYSDSLENETDTLVALTVTPDSLGYFLDDTTFVAENIGVGKVTAELDDLSDSIIIRIQKQRDFDFDHKLTVLPKDTIINVGSTVQYNAYYQYDEMLVDTTADSWSVSGMDIGAIDETGLFNSTSTGFGMINAYMDNSIGTSFLIVEDSTTDDDINTITLTRDHPSPVKDIKVIKTLTEGERWIIGGMPHPFNIYNGGMLYFPVGCISEDIRIHISLPKFADIDVDSVNFGNGKRKILNAINFQVYVNDTTLTEPYYFDSPLIAGLVFKRGLLRQYNIEPENLSLYYVNNDTANMDFDSTGIIQPVVDYYHNRIYSGIAHFSTLAIAGRSGGSVVETEETKIPLPEKFSLQQNYPNPFNPTTTLRFDLNEKADVRLDIYNVLGKKVETLVNGNFNRGTYKVQWNASEMPSGIYFIRMTAGQKTATIRSLLLK